jgi:hypothetical protein
VKLPNLFHGCRGVLAMSKFNAIKLPFHRLHLLDSWGSKSDSKLHKAHSLIAKLVLYKLWKEGLEPEKEVLPSIEANANHAMDQIREAVVESDVSFLGDLLEAAKENRDLREKGLRQDYKRKIILAFSQLYHEKNVSPRPLVWVEAADGPKGITLAPRGGWSLAEPVEPTKKQLWLHLCASGDRIPKSTYTHYLKDIGLDDLKSDLAGRPCRRPKLVHKRFF